MVLIEKHKRLLARISPKLFWLAILVIAFAFWNGHNVNQEYWNAHVQAEAELAQRHAAQQTHDDAVGIQNAIKTAEIQRELSEPLISSGFHNPAE